jgi:protein prenyltransferase alpha subunit repeat containing protein 1
MSTILIDSPPRASIEILPGGLKEWKDIEVPPEVEKPSPLFPFVFVEGNLGVPKKILCAVYLAAVNMSWRSSDVRTANAASSVIILLNPAHQTALNARKRLIRDGQLDASKELLFTELVARGSPECGKQSMMWDHRRWCFGQIYGIMGSAAHLPYIQHWASSEEVQIFPRMSPAAVQHELGVIRRTCETYPRNYYGWSQWHFMINICYASIHFSEDTAAKREFFGIITQSYMGLRNWVNHHVSDYSAMHQLCQIQNLLEHLTRIESLTINLMSDLTPSTLAAADHALSLVTAFPNHESLWMYLRVSVAGLSPETRTNFLERIKNQSVSEETSSHFAKQLFSWFSRQESLSVESTETI